MYIRYQYIYMISIRRLILIFHRFVQILQYAYYFMTLTAFDEIYHMHVNSDNLEQSHAIYSIDVGHVMTVFRISSCNSCDHTELDTDQVRTKPPRVWVGIAMGLGGFVTTYRSFLR